MTSPAPVETCTKLLTAQSRPNRTEPPLLCITANGLTTVPRPKEISGPHWTLAETLTNAPERK
jgi:hypothetical protein